MSKFKFENDLNTGITIINNIFITDYLPLSPPDFVKIYIASMSIAQSSSEDEFDSGRLGKALNLEKDVILSAWEYWESKELISLVPYQTESGESDFIIKFNTPKVLPKAEVRPAAPVSPARRLADSFQDNGIKDMFDFIKALMGRELNQNELMVFLDWVDSYHFPPDLVTMLVHDCIERGKNEMGYMKKIALDWFKAGVDTLDKAEAQQAKHREKWQKYSKVLGFFRINRQPSITEEKYMEKWFFEYEIDEEVVMKACEQTIKTLKPSFEYVDTILQDWKRSGVKTVADVDARMKARENKQTAPNNYNQSKPKNAYPQKNAAPNFTGRTYDTVALRDKLVKKGRGELNDK